MEEAVDGGNAATVRDHMQKQEGSRKKSSDLSHLPSSHLLLLLISVLTQVEARQQVDLGEAVQRKRLEYQAGERAGEGNWHRQRETNHHILKMIYFCGLGKIFLKINK